MRILYVTRYYHPVVGGVETQTRLVANHLARDHDVAVATGSLREARLPPRLEILADSLLLPTGTSYDDGAVRVIPVGPSPLERLRLAPTAVRAVPLVRMAVPERLRRLAYRSFRRVYVPKLRRLVRGCDVVHAVVSDYLGWAALEAARAEGVPFVVTPYVHPGAYGDDAENAAFYRRADLVFALLDSDRDVLVDLGVDRERIRLTGVVPLLPAEADPDGFRRQHDLRCRPIVLYVGRLVGYKGAPALREAAELVWRADPEVVFLFAGPGDPEEIAAIAPDHEGRVRHLGLVDDRTKADALAACDLFCMPSRHEVLPAVYLEAWASGKAVVGGTAHGLPELIEGNGAGVTVEQDPGAIAAAVVDLLRDEPRRRRMGERGRALVDAQYSAEALTAKLAAAYAEVVGTPRPRGRASAAGPAEETRRRKTGRA